MRKLKRYEITKRMYSFIIIFVCYSGAIILYDYFFVKAEIDYSRILFNAAAVSLGITFIDLGFSREKNVD